MLRVSTSSFYTLAAQQMVQQQTELARIQEQVSTGKRILRPSDDPVGAARAIDINLNITQLEQYNKNAIYAETRLKLEDSTLGSVVDLIHRVKDLALAANSGTASLETRAAYASEVQERLQELIDIANVRDANGDYLFSGFQGKVKPFVLNAGTISYNGDQGQQFIQVGASRQVATTDSGFEIFQRIRNGNGTFQVSLNQANTGTAIIEHGSVVNQSAYQPHSFTIQFTSPTTYDVINTTTSTTILAAQPYVDGGSISFNGVETNITGTPQAGDEFFVAPSQNQNIFNTLQSFINAMGMTQATATDQARLAQDINNVIGELDQGLNHLLEVRTRVGSRLSSLEATQLEIDAVKYELEVSLSQLTDIDYAEAISRLQYQLLTLETTQKTFSSIEGLSLFNYFG